MYEEKDRSFTRPFQAHDRCIAFGTTYNVGPLVWSGQETVRGPGNGLRMRPPVGGLALLFPAYLLERV
jgi:hypothetical protein